MRCSVPWAGTAPTATDETELCGTRRHGCQDEPAGQLSCIDAVSCDQRWRRDHGLRRDKKLRRLIDVPPDRAWSRAERCGAVCWESPGGSGSSGDQGDVEDTDHLRCVIDMEARRPVPCAEHRHPIGGIAVPGGLTVASQGARRSMCGADESGASRSIWSRARPHWARMRKWSAGAPKPSRCRIAHNRRTRKSLKEIREAVSDRGRGVRSRGERPPTRGAPNHRR